MFFPEALLNSPMFGIGLTIIVYVFCEPVSYTHLDVYKRQA